MYINNNNNTILVFKIKAGYFTPKWDQIPPKSCVFAPNFFFLIFGVGNAWLGAYSHDLVQIDTIRDEFRLKKFGAITHD